MIDTADYYAFLLDAFDRFPREGLRLRPYGGLPLFRSQKAAVPLIGAVGRRLGPIEGPVLEFGVWKGRTLRALARAFPANRIVGFDSFAGFPSDGRKDWSRDFALVRPPRPPAGGELVIGDFAASLPGFADTLTPATRLRLIHIDCDLYSSTRTVLTGLSSWIDAGCVLIFDELTNYSRFPENEFLALYQFLAERDLDFTWYATLGAPTPFEAFCQAGGGKTTMREQRAAGYHQNAAVQLTVDSGKAARISRFRPLAEHLAGIRPLDQPLAR